MLFYFKLCYKYFILPLKVYNKKKLLCLFIIFTNIINAFQIFKILVFGAKNSYFNVKLSSIRT